MLAHFLILDFHKDLMMIIKAFKNENTEIALAIVLISLVTITLISTSCFPQSNIRIKTETLITQVPKQSSLLISLTSINETNSLNVTKSSDNYSSALLKTDPVSSDALNSTNYAQTDLLQFFFSFRDSTNQEQTVGSDVSRPIAATGVNETDTQNEGNLCNNSSDAALVAVPVSLSTSEFVAYTYGGYPVQQPDSTDFNFSFPDNISQGQIAGSDALTWNVYPIQEMGFDVTFNTPQINALGFDEMAIFATSNTNNYKGTEFGIRMDLKDGFIYGYVQEPNGTNGDVNFQMVELMPNDGMMHHYTLIMLGSVVAFCVDGVNYHYLNFPSNTDYSSLSYSICAVVHRFTDDWNSTGDNMVTGNFMLDQQ
jgi:hypothetical protein